MFPRGTRFIFLGRILDVLPLCDVKQEDTKCRSGRGRCIEWVVFYARLCRANPSRSSISHLHETPPMMA